MINTKDLSAIVLAAGKGKRLKCTTTNKTAICIGGKPMVAYTIENLKKAGLNKIICIVGFAAESVKKALENSVEYGFQNKRLGTAHAVKCGLKFLKDTKNIFVLNGDDSAFYPPELFTKMLEIQEKRKPAITMLTVKRSDPTGLGRIVRDPKTDYVIKIVEEKNTNEEEKLIKEINAACYIFEENFLRKFINKVKKNSVSGEYYLTDLIELAVENKLLIQTLIWPDETVFQGVNTPDQLIEAQKRLEK